MPPTNDPYTELAELAGGFIHEIKNHISTLNLNLQLLGDDFSEPQNPRERRALDRINRLQGECRRLVDISNDFLRFARSQQLHQQPTQLSEVIGEMVDFFTPTAKQGGHYHHLVSQQCHAGSAGGPGTLQAGAAKPHVERPTSDARGRRDYLAISHETRLFMSGYFDTGCGIAGEQLEKIFQPFHTSKVDGSGLGLATTRKIIQAHGGTIGVISDVGRGTKFTIELPAANTDTKG